MRKVSNVIKEKYSLNILSGLLYQFINTILGLILPYLFITSLGSEVNGLLNSVGQLFVCLSLLEAGVGAATLQALYRPIYQNDRDNINSILSATNYYYKKTGLYYAICIVAVGLVYPYIVDSKINNNTIRIIILLQGIGQIMSYFVQAKYSILLTAEGKNYILNLLLLFESIIRNAGKIIIIRLGYGVILVQTVHLFTLCIHASLLSLYIFYKYKWLDIDSKPNFEAIEQKNSVLKQTIAWLVFNHTSFLVLTIITRNLALVSVYSIYTLVFETVQNINNVVRDSYKYKIGISIQKSKKDFTSYFSNYSIWIFAFTYASFCITYYFSMPFIKIYTKNVSDINYMLKWFPELFLIYKILYCIRATYRQIIETGGYFKETESIAIKEAILNVLLSLIFVYIFSIYGVLIASVSSLLICLTSYIRFVMSNTLELYYKILSFKMHILYTVITLVIIVINHKCVFDNTMSYKLLINIIVFSLVIMLIFFIVSLFIYRQSIKQNINA